MKLEPFQLRILASIRRFPRKPLTGPEFAALALATYARQRRLNPVYRAFCEMTGVPEKISDWRLIPALPVTAFKAARVACFGGANARLAFRTSGTTQGASRGEHIFRTSEFYDAAIDALFGRFVMGGLKRAAFASLVPPAREKKDSSLSYMAARAMRVFAGERFEAVRGEKTLFGPLARKLEAWSRVGKPVVIFSTTLALGAFLEYLKENGVRMRLARGSRIMETGGSKGKLMRVSREDCARLAGRLLGIPARLVVNEYGMTELSSQFYGSGAVKKSAPWTRVLAIDPATGREARRGAKGLLRVLDLANQDSCAFIQTEDEGRLVPGGFELAGRKPGADLRGCSLTFEELEALA